ncbi:MAG: N-acetyltransferase family protein [Spirosomataceae bacterium]
MEIRNLTPQDYDQVAEVYRQGIATGFATFQNDIPDWESWDKSHLQVCRLGAFEGDILAGWAALTPVSSRCVYAGVAEVSVYVGANFRGKGVGEKLLLQLIEASEAFGLWTLQSGIFPDNKASIALHEKCGFRMIGYREKIGQKNGEWKDNVIMERRSKLVGV